MPVGASADGSDHRDMGVAPQGPMDDQPLLPRRGLLVGAIGNGADGRRYRLLAPIDRGGMGELFLAELTQPHQPSRYVVLKRLLADLLDDEKYVAMFRSEADIMSKLDHDNIVRVFDTPTIENAPCLAMEYVRGRNVHQILMRHEELGTKMPPAIVLKIMADCLAGLGYAHDYRLPDGTHLELVHRDVTPGNVLVSFDGDVKLTDFGIAKSQMSAVSTTVGIVKGKARYLSPEQILGEAATPQSDIFSAASVVCEMLTNVPTYDRVSVPKTLYAIVNGNRAELEEVLDFRAPLLVQILDRALETDPKKRIQTANELREGIEAASRLLPGPRVERQHVAEYMSDLFRDVEDPLADYEHAPAGIASPGTQPSASPGELPTVHAYRPAEPPASAPPQKAARAAEKFHPTEVIRRETNELAADLIDNDSADTAALAATGIAEVILEEDPSVPSAEALAVAAESAYSSTASGTQIVRGQPVADPAEQQEEAFESVDEALSVLAWLQSRQAEQAGQTPPPPVGDKAPTKPAPTASTSAPDARLDLSAHVPDEPLPELKSKRGPMLLVFTLGLLIGVVGTLAGQALLGEDAPPKTEVAAADAVESPAQAPPPPKPEPEPEPEPEPKKPTLEVPPVELEAPPPPPAPPAKLDILYPRGARVRVDGRLLQRKVPIYGIELDDGNHTIRVFKKRGYKKSITFAAKRGEQFELKKKLKKK